MLFLALLSLSLTLGCKTNLEVGGVYAPTNSVGQVIYNDQGLFLADATWKFSYEAMLSVFQFERDNRIALWGISPTIKHKLDSWRPAVVDIRKRWAESRHLYKQNPTPAGLSTLQGILSELNRLLPVVQAQIDPAVHALVVKPQP
jgi:hypothetical protein